MALRIYNDGDHPSGFIGVRVVWRMDGEYKQKYFNFRTQDRKGFISRSQELDLIDQARKLEQKWKSRADKIKYQRVLMENHPNTLPYHGLGFTGITMIIRWDLDYRRLGHYPPTKSDFSYFTPGFRAVSATTAGDAFFNIHKLGFDAAWTAAVDRWAQRYSVNPKDKKRILIEKCPSIDQFKQLRRHLNKQGWAIPLQVVNSIV